MALGIFVALLRDSTAQGGPDVRRAKTTRQESRISDWLSVLDSHSSAWPARGRRTRPR